jgi:hypothetical protein
MLFYLTILNKYIDCLETPYYERRRTKDAVTSRLVTLPRINQQMERIGPRRETSALRKPEYQVRDGAGRESTGRLLAQ